MTIKEVYAPHLGHNVKLGRRHPVAPCPHLSFGRYRLQNLPAPPTGCDYSAKALPSLDNIFLNDVEGNCVIAGGYHIVGVETGNAATIFLPTSAQLNADYSAIGGYVPGNPNTDNGCDEQTALNYWTSHGFANGTKLVGWLAVDASNQTEVKQAMFLFENLYFGIDLPDAWISPFPSANGFVWDVAGEPDPDNGHCIVGVGYANTTMTRRGSIVGYTANGIIVDTWGMLGILTWAALAYYCVPSNGGALYVMLSPDQLAKGASKAPNGIAWSDLIADFDALGGNIPVPSPVPPSPTPPAPPAPPAPTPPAPTGVTLQQAQKWATSELRGMQWVAPRVADGLQKHWPK